MWVIGRCVNNLSDLQNKGILAPSLIDRSIIEVGQTLTAGQKLYSTAKMKKKKKKKKNMRKTVPLKPYFLQNID